ncbi:MAG TPA: hydrogenase maturation protease [Terriglobales bacterium]|nr:hydrogenase maturation protease [Terriglobales bacterium]
MNSAAEFGCDTPNVLVVCLGNPLRSDDGLGWHAAEELTSRLHSPAVKIVTRFQLTPDLAEPVHSAECVLFVDAGREGRPGELTFSPLVPRAEATSSHHLSPAALLQLTSQLYGSVPSAFLASICGECFDFGEHLSQKVAAELPRLITRVIQLAERIAN